MKLFKIAYKFFSVGILKRQLIIMFMSFSRNAHGDFLLNNKEDEYSNLMSLRERQWIVNIQLNQLKCENPFLDDYYYTVFNQKVKSSDSKNINDALKKENEDIKLSGEAMQEERYLSKYASLQLF